MEDIKINIDDIMFEDFDEEQVQDNEENETPKEKEGDDNKNVSEDEDPEGVANDKDDEGKEDDPDEVEATSSPNVYTNLVKALIEEDVFPSIDLNERKVENWDDFKSLFEEYVEKEVNDRLDDSTKIIKKALENDANISIIEEHQNIIAAIDSISDDDVNSEEEDGIKLRQKILYQYYQNRGFSHEENIEMIKRSFESGRDIDDAKRAMPLIKKFSQDAIDDEINKNKEKIEQQKKENEKFYSDLYKSIETEEEPIKGVKIDKQLRQKILNNLKKPVAKDENGRQMNAIQQYAKENPMKFQQVLSTLFTLTDGFKSFDKIKKSTSRAAKKSVVSELEEKLLLGNMQGLSDNEIVYERKNAGVFGKDFDIILED